jgi:hypothetical protein
MSYIFPITQFARPATIFTLLRSVLPFSILVSVYRYLLESWFWLAIVAGDIPNGGKCTHQ